MSNGTDDPLVPFQGKLMGTGYGLLSVPNTLEFRATVNICQSALITWRLPHAVPDDGTTVHVVSRPNPDGSVKVRAYIIEHGGHTSPGVPTGLEWARIAGKTTMALRATDAMWDFFARHPKP